MAPCGAQWMYSSLGTSDSSKAHASSPPIATIIITSGSSARLARTMLQILLLQPGDPDALVGARQVPRQRGTRRSRRPASAKPAFHAFPGGTGGRSALYIVHLRHRRQGIKSTHSSRNAFCFALGKTWRYSSPSLRSPATCANPHTFSIWTDQIARPARLFKRRAT